jgi:hypothetical protein
VKEAMRQVESLTELYFATAKAIPSLFAVAESMQVAFSRGKSHLSLSTPRYSKPGHRFTLFDGWKSQELTAWQTREHETSRLKRIRAARECAW